VWRVSGTDILKKQLAEGRGGGEMGDFDFTNMTELSANHAPYRSKSLQAPQGDQTFGNPMMQQQQQSPPGRPNDYSYMNTTGGGRGGLSPNTPPGMMMGGLSPQQMMAGTTPPQQQQQFQQAYAQQQQQQQQQGNAAPQGMNRSPSLKVRRYSFLAGSRNGRGFSDIFNSAILTDHFDQYSAGQERVDSGLGTDDGAGRVPVSSGMANHLSVRPPSVHAPLQHQHHPHHHKDASPDSGLSDDDSKLRPLQRRRTLPCIVGNKPDGAAGGAGAVGGAGASSLAAASQAVKDQVTAHSSEDLAAKAVNPDTYIIENGIRKRVKAEVYQRRAGESRPPGTLPRQFTIEENPERRETREARARGSLPDLKHVTSVKPIPKVEAYRLSNERREELRRLQELAERRRHGDVGVIFGDVKVRFQIKLVHNICTQ
jgi:hypothetical protein